MVGIAEKDELPLVLREISDAMAAGAAALTLHPTGPHLSSLIHLDADSPLAESASQIVDMADAFILSEEEGRHAWHDGFAERGHAVLHIPVERIPGHGRLVISVFFDSLSDAARHQAEAVYLARRPFAVGYFRLWQVARLQVRYAKALETVLDLTEAGVALIDQDGDIAFANEAAKELLASGDGLRRKHHSLRATNLADGIRLQVTLDHVTSANGEDRGANPEGPTPVMALRRRTAPPLIASVIPTDLPATEPSDIAAILYLVDPQQDAAAILAPLCRLYQLSPTETALVCHLAAGRTIQELAALMKIKEQTARSYLKQIFIKTDTNRQTELVVLMLSSIVRMKQSLVQKALSRH